MFPLLYAKSALTFLIIALFIDHILCSINRKVSYEIFALQGDNGGMMTMSNLTHKVSREDNGLSLTCEAFNKGTRYSRVRSEELIVYCE